MPDVDPAIAHLDWPICQCQTETGQCTNEAAIRAEFHALDHCNRPHDELNEAGNRTLDLCSPCYQTIRAKAAEYVLRRAQYGRPMCLGCGAPVTCVKQVIREAHKL